MSLNMDKELQEEISIRATQILQNNSIQEEDIDSIIDYINNKDVDSIKDESLDNIIKEMKIDKLIDMITEINLSNLLNN